MAYGKTKEWATAAAKKLLKKMKTKGWKIRVHENRGWCYNLTNGPISLHEGNPKTGNYFCLISSVADEPWSGLAMWTETDVPEEFTKDPNVCVKRAVSYARSVLNDLIASIEVAEKAVSKKK